MFLRRHIATRLPSKGTIVFNPEMLSKESLEQIRISMDTVLSLETIVHSYSSLYALYNFAHGEEANVVL
jgi:hypothetical protein